MLCSHLNAQTTNYHQTFGTTLGDAQNALQSITTDLDEVAKPSQLKGTLGLGTNAAIVVSTTHELSTFSSQFSNPGNTIDNYLITEPGANTPTNFAIYSGYTKTLLWSETVYSNSSDNLFDFNVAMASMSPGSGTNTFGEHTFVSITADVTHVGVTNNHLFMNVPYTDLTSAFALLKHYYFVLPAGDITLKIELTHKKGEYPVIAIDDIYFDFAQGFRLTRTEYCVDENAIMEPTTDACASNSCTAMEVFEEGNPTPVATYSNYADFADHKFTSAGNYTFRMTKGSFVLYRGLEQTVTNKYEGFATVYDAPNVLTGMDPFEARQIGDLTYSFKHNIEMEDETRFSWNFGDNQSSTAPKPSHTYDEATAVGQSPTKNQFNVAMTAYNKFPRPGCSTDDDLDILVCTYDNRPTIDFDATADVNSKTIDITNITSGFSKYFWTYGSNQHSEEARTSNANFSKTYLNYGPYPITLTIEDGVCVAEASELVELCETIDATIISTACDGTITFEVTSSNFNSIEWWDVTNTHIELGSGQQYEYEAPLHQVERTVRVIMDNGCGEPTVKDFGLTPLSEPSSDFLAFPQNNTLSLQALRTDESIFDYQWNVESFDESNQSLGTQSYSSKSESYSLPSNTVSVTVELTVTRSGTSCYSTTSKTVCIPSATHDCCESCGSGS